VGENPKIIPDSGSIYELEWEKELKEYIINRRIHDYYINATQRIKRLEMTGTMEWYDRKYKTIIKHLDYEIGTAVDAIKNKYPLNMKDKNNTIINNFHGPANNQFGDNNTQHIQQTIQNLEQQIDQLNIPPEKKNEAKGLAKQLLGIVIESVTTGAVKGTLG
jgi:hypothetical protein